MIEFHDVTKSFKKNVAIQNLSFNIKNNTLNLFLGLNGSGKSTTMKLISKVIMLKNRDQGKIENDFRWISYLPERYELPSSMRVINYLDLIKRYEGSSLDINYLLKGFEIPNKAINSLSKGMRQKLGIVTSFIGDYDLYLLDEPDDGLDKKSLEFFLCLIKEKLESGSTIVISTHDKKLYNSLEPKTYYFDKSLSKGVKNGRVYKRNKKTKEE